MCGLFLRSRLKTLALIRLDIKNCNECVASVYFDDKLQNRKWNTNDILKWDYEKDVAVFLNQGLTQLSTAAVVCTWR